MKIPAGKPPGTSAALPLGPLGDAALQSSGLPGDQDALIHPTREPGEEPVTPTVILSFTQPDYRDLCRLGEAHGQPRQFFGCACRPASWQGAALTMAAPALGAPYAAMVLEKLIALGARRVLALGWCGSLSPAVRLGSLILPHRALSGDGTSPHYCRHGHEPLPHVGLYDLLAANLHKGEVPWHTGPVWSTDAFFRETGALVNSCQQQGVLGIDMEMAALFAVGRFRGIAVAGLLVVSDELFTLKWRPARGAPAFRAARQAAVRLVLAAAAQGEGLDV